MKKQAVETKKSRLELTWSLPRHHQAEQNQHKSQSTKNKNQYTKTLPKVFTIFC